jgi:hypothetical protein
MTTHEFCSSANLTDKQVYTFRDAGLIRPGMPRKTSRRSTCRRSASRQPIAAPPDSSVGSGLKLRPSN